jgi:hypothetical protein
MDVLNKIVERGGIWFIIAYIAFHNLSHKAHVWWWWRTLHEVCGEVLSWFITWATRTWLSTTCPLTVGDKLKDWLDDQGGEGEWIRADRNSSRRTNSAYDPNSQPRIPTRVCQGRVVTTDLPTLGTNPKRSQSESKIQEAKNLGDLRSPRQTVRGDRADGPRWQGGRSAWRRRTVREVAADGPKKPTEPPSPYPEKWMICALSLDGRRATCAAQTVRDV